MFEIKIQFSAIIVFVVMAVIALFFPSFLELSVVQCLTTDIVVGLFSSHSQIP